MRPEEVPDHLVEKAAESAHAKIVNDWAVQPPWDEISEGLRDRTRAVTRHALAAVLSLEEVWVGGPDALPLPPQVITHEGVFHKDGVTPLEITDEMMEAGGWKKRQRLVTEWVNA